MAQLVTGAIGAAVGYVVSGFNPAGAYWGWTIGVAVGTVLFPPEGIDQVGPQLGDKGVQTSTYGAPIPVVYGTIRTAGNIIWATDIVEKTHVDKVGGKGGPSVTSTTFTYYGNIAVGICEGEAELLRIWANGKLIYDISGIAVVDIQKPGVEFTFYNGSETQLPDPLIESVEGIGQVPAHRGLCYIVFDELPLADYGNGIPQLTFEVTRVAQNRAYSTPAINTDATFKRDLNYVDWTRALNIRVKAANSKDANITELSFLDLETMTSIEKTCPDDFPNTTQFDSVIGTLPNSKNLVFRVRDGATPDFYYIEVSPDTFAEVSRVTDDLGSTILTFDDRANKKNAFHIGFSVRGTEFIAWQTWGGNRAWLYESGVGTVGALIPVISGVSNFLPMPDTGFTGGFYETRDDVLGTNFTITKREFRYVDISVNDYTPTTTVVATIPITDIHPDWISFSGIHYSMVDEVDGNIVAILYGPAPLAIKVDVTTGDLLWVSKQLDLDIPFLARGFPTRSLLLDGRYGWVSRTEISYELDLATGAVTQIESGYADAVIYDGMAYNSRTRVATTMMALYYIGRKIGLPTTVQAVMDDLTGKAGLAPADVDTSALASLSLPGYMMSRNMQAKAAMEPLANLYLFDVVEVDDILEFVPRGGAVAGTLTEQDLVVEGDKGTPIAEIRGAETELPAEINVSYMDPNNDYHQITHRARRILSPVSEVDSTNKLNLQVAAALDPDFVKAQAQILLTASWVERVTRAMIASRPFLKYVPTDVITLTLDDGRTVRTRIITAEIGQNLSYSLFAVEEDSAQYSSSATADSGSGVPGQTVQSAAALRLILVRSPLLRDEDDVGRSYSSYYYFMGVIGSGSLGVGLLYQSDTGDGYEQIGSVTSEPTWGYAVDSLPDIPFDEKWQQDNINTLNVVLKNELSTLQSVTFDQLLAGSTNAFALIHSNGDVELMKFQTVVAEADGTFTLSGLLRGRRGTDPFTEGHSGGDIFVMLDATGSIATTTLGNLDVDKYMKAVPAGSLLENAQELIEANPGNDLKPYAPVWVESDGALWGTDIDFSWIRRTRIGGELRNLTGTVLVNEDTEEYEAEIWDGITLKRTFTGLTTPAFTYTVAQQTADSWTPSEVSVIVYQVSAQVGRGFPSYKTVIGV